MAKGPGLASLLPPPQISRRGLDGFSGAHTDMGVGGGARAPSTTPAGYMPAY